MRPAQLRLALTLAACASAPPDPNRAVRLADLDACAPQRDASYVELRRYFGGSRDDGYSLTTVVGVLDTISTVPPGGTFRSHRGLRCPSRPMPRRARAGGWPARTQQSCQSCAAA